MFRSYRLRLTLLAVAAPAFVPFACGQHEDGRVPGGGAVEQRAPAGEGALTDEEAATLPADAATLSTGEVVFQRIRVLDGAGKELSSDTKGELTVAQWQRAARPWTGLGEAHLYHEQVWDRTLEDGAIEHGYRVVRTPNDSPRAATKTSGPPALGPGLADLPAATDADPVTVILRLRDYPEWDIPLAPPADLFDE